MQDPLAAFLCAQLGALPGAPAAAVAGARVTQLHAGQALLQAGQAWSQLFWLEQGALRLYYLDRDGHAANKNFYLDGAMLWPLTPALAGSPVDFWVEAVGASRVWVLPWRAWQDACADWPAWQALERRMLATLLDDKMRREQQFLQCSAEQRYQTLCATRPEWLARIPLRHLASYLGITDVALSRIRRRLKGV
jgi:CRP-like cAMP-binding protein